MNNSLPNIYSACGEIDDLIADINIVLATEIKPDPPAPSPFQELCNLTVEVFYSISVNGHTTPWVGLCESIRVPKGSLELTADDLIAYTISDLPELLNRLQRVKITSPIKPVSPTQFLWKMLKKSVSQDGLRCLHGSHSESVRTLHVRYFQLKSSSSLPKTTQIHG
jgi:hypothetical protein